ncbi:MAG: helix-turn-helix transcriptional regulator [Acidaminococcaceae bacterium]|nr:helix-turn-helix transcriptional regulator [Acidaminococcaceae bacterium]
MKYGTDIVFRYIGARIAYYRVLRGLTPEELADAAHINQIVLQKIEVGTYQKKLCMSHLQVIAGALQTDCETMLHVCDAEMKYLLAHSKR